MTYFLIFLGVASLITFLLYVADKSKAQRGAWRIPERVLLFCGFFGGAVGGLLAMQLVRHKTKHWYFYAVNFLGIAWQAVFAYAIYCGWITF